MAVGSLIRRLRLELNAIYIYVHYIRARRDYARARSYKSRRLFSLAKLDEPLGSFPILAGVMDKMCSTFNQYQEEEPTPDIQNFSTTEGSNDDDSFDFSKW